jgi:hypothetical protein
MYGYRMILRITVIIYQKSINYVNFAIETRSTFIEVRSGFLNITYISFGFHMQFVKQDMLAK